VTPGNQAAVRYSPGTITSTDKKIVTGDPDERSISTSLVERSNLTDAHVVAAVHALDIALLEKLENHAAAIALQFAHYNVCRWHETIRCTPANGVARDRSSVDGRQADRRGTVGARAGTAHHRSARLAAVHQRGEGEGRHVGDDEGELYVIKGGKGRRR
jgi:hypothetical protein